MAEPLPPSPRRTASTPAAPKGFTGVLLAAPPTVTYRARAVVSGVYQIPEADAARIDDRLHRALVALRTSGAPFQVWNPFHGAVLFGDDDERSPGWRRGYFEFDAFPGLGELVPGDYYIMVSLGVFLSSPVRVLVR